MMVHCSVTFEYSIFCGMIYKYVDNFPDVFAMYLSFLNVNDSSFILVIGCYILQPARIPTYFIYEIVIILEIFIEGSYFCRGSQQPNR